MTVKQKMFELECIVYDCYCSMEMFLENVKSCGEVEFRTKFKKCNSHDDLVKLVNQYI
jgi:hypothetical protein